MQQDSIEKASSLMDNKARGGTVSFVIGIVVLVIVVSTVAIPIINDATTAKTNSTGGIIENASVTGTDATIIGVVGTLLAVLIIVMVANAMG